MPSLSVAELQVYLQTYLPTVEVIGNPAIPISNVAKIEEASDGDISFVANPKYERYLTETRASAIIISSSFTHTEPPPNRAFIKVPDAYTAFVFVLEKFLPPSTVLPNGIHTSAVLAASAKIPASVQIGANVYIGECVVIGERTKIFPNTVILDDTVIGEDCILYPNVTIHDKMKIGNRVILHAGVVIGADGFGFAPQADGSYKKIPQIGTVILEDDVELGANTCIDRATLGETIICKGVKLDNLVQIAHNCRVGKHTVIASQTGVSGSTKIGEHCMIAGQVGFAGHIELGNKITVGGHSGVSKNFLKEGETIRGYPARPMRQQLRQEALQAKLGDLFERMKQLEAELAALKSIREA
jgi:UDP-3-O-[3-hydroxymyristoyl] glucosamine N-acyltransferase